MRLIEWAVVKADDSAAFGRRIGQFDRIRNFLKM